MKKLFLIIVGVSICAVGFFLSIKYSDNGYTNKKQEKETTQKEFSPVEKYVSNQINNEHNHDHSHHDHDHAHNDSVSTEDIFAILPQEQVEEIKPFISRNHKDLVIENDDTVNLKKKYSHVFISYIDENGNKQQKEL